MAGLPLKLGILGCGAISQFAHVPAVLRSKRVELVALCDAAEDLVDQVAAVANVKKTYTDYDAMLADARVDAIVIAAPDPFHVPLANRAMRAGKHVLVEKPLGETSSQCLELIEVQKQTGMKVQVGSMKRHDPGMVFAKRFLKEKAGLVFSVGAVYRDSIFRADMQESTLDPLRVSERIVKPQNDPKAEREHYNLFTQGVHLVDNVRYLAGEVLAITAQVSHHNGNWSWHGLLEFAEGGRGHFELTCKSCGDWCERYEVLGDNGSVQIEVPLPFYHRPSVARCYDGQTQQWTQPLGGRSNAYANQLDYFAAVVQDDLPASPDAYDGFAAVQLLEAIEQSVITGQRIAINQPFGEAT